MAALGSGTAASSTKMLLLGDSKSGKTGSLASLARAGYRLRIIDFDRGTEILYHHLKDDPAALARVDVITCTDDFILQPVTNKWIPKVPIKSFPTAMKALDKWDDGSKPTDWDTDTILVIDSLTFLGESCMRMVLSANNKLGEQPSQPNWGAAMGLQEDVLAGLYADSIKCHVIVVSHIAQIEIAGANQGFPSALGNKLPPKVGRYFNGQLMVKTTGSGTAKVRKIFTQSQGNIELGSPSPAAKSEYPLATGMADYFKDLHGPLKAAGKAA